MALVRFVEVEHHKTLTDAALFDHLPNSLLVVIETAEITGRGLALFFQSDPDPIPAQYRLHVQITRPNGTIITSAAQRELARKVPPGEVVAFLLPGVSKSDVPVDSTIVILEEDAGEAA